MEWACSLWRAFSFVFAPFASIPPTLWAFCSAHKQEETPSCAHRVCAQRTVCHTCMLAVVMGSVALLRSADEATQMLLVLLVLVKVSCAVLCVAEHRGRFGGGRFFV